jgi:hypothetical protein
MGDSTFPRASLPDETGASTYVPYMMGYGGNLVALHPNGVTVFRFSDGFNYEIYPMVQVAGLMGTE